MNIRWRLGILILQLAAILFLSYLVTDQAVSAAAWYASLFAIIINTQLLEPYFPKPGDTLANSLIGLVFYFLSSKEITHLAWNTLAVILGVSAFLSAASLLLGARRTEGAGVPIARGARMICRVANARSIYSLIFWISLTDFTGGINKAFWELGLVWLIVMILGSVKWQAALSTAAGLSSPCTVEGLRGPSRIHVSAAELPRRGTRVRITGTRLDTTGVVTSRIRRKDDLWGEIHIADSSVCEKICSLPSITIQPLATEGEETLGVVDTGSSHLFLVFMPTKALRIGDVVCVPYYDTHIAYQISSAEIQESQVKGGAHQVVRARSNQLGIFDSEALTLKRHPWVPQPGAPVIRAPAFNYEMSPDEGSKILLGHVIGTEIPIFLDCNALCQGHLAILGMTRMGKTTLAVRMASELSKERSVVVLDQTGEYISRQELPAYNEEIHKSIASLSVFEPPSGKDVSIPDEGLKHFGKTMRAGYIEYLDGTPFPGVLIVDEAHQFIPEPAILGFGSAGRESAIKFGMYMMQVRKYGIAIILISQRTAVVAKSALSQCENLIAFKSVDQTGLEYLEAVLGGGARDMLPTLNQGEALVFGPAISSETAVAIKVATG
jgi:hypothetical protein